MIFTKIYTEGLVQTNDVTRIKIDSFVSGDSATISKIEVSPDSTGVFYDVTNDGFLDWSYVNEIDETITARVTDSNLIVDLQTGIIKVISPSTDNLFSFDTDILAYENDLLKWVQDGRRSFIDKHRVSQIEILNELDSSKIWKNDGTRYVASDIVDIQEFKEWSKFITLRTIFQNISNATDDIFNAKASRYKSMAVSASSRATLKLDHNGDGIIDDNETLDTFSGVLCRR